ncbi:MAG: L-rhamnose/proton symporter RhaT [Capsulimonas sp.]|uniref:L-rhamnose/proton symporter RhaT n=1 Tax=Capsulimonas sp. TaxID=2494211 RepID=UPI0032655539
MAPAFIFGIILHWIGGLAAASFYIPYKQIRRWSWETYWLTGGVFSWLLMPSLMASILVPGTFEILHTAKPSVLFYTYFFGAMWGIGGLTFGLTMRYLGIALGMAVALGYTAIFGTLIPPLFHGTLGQTLGSASGKYVLLGVLVSVAGIAVSGMAGMSKERELTGEQKQSSITEFQFGKGMLIATFSGIMSSCLAFGLDAGTPIADAAKASLLAHGGSDIWQGLPVLIVALLGGFTTNFLWCVGLNVRNKSAGEYTAQAASDGSAVPLIRNYAFAALAGIIWYLQFFFHTMGQAKMGKTFAFTNWTLHMASIMIFSMLWGVYLKEWAGTSKRTHTLIGLGLALLIGSTIIIGYGSYLDGIAAH